MGQAEQYLNEKVKNNREIFIDDAAVESGIDKVLLFEAMKKLERDGLGQVVVGRRGGKTRFEVGKTKEQSKIAVALAVALEDVIKEKDCEFSIEVDSLVSKFDKKDIVSAFKILESKELGSFMVGRKGAKSRFEVGKSKTIKVASKKKPVQTVDDSEILVLNPPATELSVKYKIKTYGNTSFAITTMEGFNSFDEAFEASELNSLANADDIKATLLKFGLVRC